MCYPSLQLGEVGDNAHLLAGGEEPLVPVEEMFLGGEFLILWTRREEVAGRLRRRRARPDVHLAEAVVPREVEVRQQDLLIGGGAQLVRSEALSRDGLSGAKA